MNVDLCLPGSATCHVPTTPEVSRPRRRCESPCGEVTVLSSAVSNVGYTTHRAVGLHLHVARTCDTRGVLKVYNNMSKYERVHREQPIAFSIWSNVIDDVVKNVTSVYQFVRVL